MGLAQQRSMDGGVHAGTPNGRKGVEVAEVGSALTMKFIIGFITGAAVGGYVVSNSTEQQRSRAAQAAADAGRRVKESRIGRAVDDNASQVAGAATDRVVGAVDSAGDVLTEKIDHDADSVVR